jgi:Flp pilus assembly protein TadG
MINKHYQKGAETVEFAIIALLFFAIIFAIIEFGRALFVWNALTEATRRGARMAVVCPYQSPIPKQVAIYDVIAGSLGTSPIIADLTPAMINVSYLDETGIATANQKLIKFVQVTLSGYTHTLIIPFWGSTKMAPPFTTTLSSESLGAVPTIPAAATTPTACNF